MSTNNPSGDGPSRPDASSAAAFVLLMTAWRLEDDEVGFLLQVEPAVWRQFRDDEGLLDFEARIRLGHCLDIAEAVSVLAPGTDQGVWLREPHPILAGRSPMYFMLRLDDALRSVRWTMLSETRPGFPGYVGK